MDEPQRLPAPRGASTADLVAAALAADGDLSDVAMFTRVLTRSFADVLPAGVLEVEHTRSLGDRLAGRPGTPVALQLTFPERQLSMRTARGWPEAEVARVVRGVVLSRKQLPVQEWVRTLATELTALAERNADARAALASLLGTV